MRVKWTQHLIYVVSFPSSYRIRSAWKNHMKKLRNKRRKVTLPSSNTFSQLFDNAITKGEKMFQWTGGHGSSGAGLGMSPCEIGNIVDFGGKRPWCVRGQNNHGITLGMSSSETAFNVDLGGGSKYSNENFKDWSGHVA